MKKNKCWENFIPLHESNWLEWEKYLVLWIGCGITWTPSMTQRSPISKGCMMKTKMMDSKTVLQVPWKATPMRTVCVIQNSIILIVATSITKSITMMIITLTTALANLWSCCTAVFVSLSDCARAFRS